MSRVASPLELLDGSVEFVSLIVETQMVVTYRLLGMAGLWAVAPSENRRMISEKAPAFAEAAMAASNAALAGMRPDQIVGAWVRPLRRKTRLNARRLRRKR